jgi:protein involved in polysaccharide export with SLBB domain
MLALGLGSARASAEDVDANPGAAPRSAFSAGVPAQRQEWQRHMTLGAGDVLSFHLFGSPELTREDEPVGPDGRVSYLEADNVMAAGLTVDELRDRLNSELGRYRRAAQVYVTPVAYHSKKYFVLGTVVKKGVFYMDRPITVIEAVARARGFETGISHGDTVEATDFSRSFLSRGGQRVPVDFGRLFLHGDLSQNVELQPNDCLFFPGVSGGEIYVLGEVGSPGPVPYDSDSSALSAIAARGGFTNKAWRARVLVVRGSLDHPQAYKVNIAGAFTGDSPNMALEPGDIVYVASSPWNRTEELIDRAGQAFAESAVVTWTGINVGPDIIHKP